MARKARRKLDALRLATRPGRRLTAILRNRITAAAADLQIVGAISRASTAERIGALLDRAKSPIVAFSDARTFAWHGRQPIDVAMLASCTARSKVLSLAPRRSDFTRIRAGLRRDDEQQRDHGRPYARDRQAAAPTTIRRGPPERTPSESP